MTAKDRRVVVLDGDGAALMRMGNLATIGAYGGDNFHHLILDNGVHESTGGQPTVSGAVSFAGIARACGYRSAASGNSRLSLGAFLDNRKGPSMLDLKIRRTISPDLPRPDITPRQVCARLMTQLGTPPFWNIPDS